MRRTDLFDFRRLVLLLVFTVCVPTAALSTFGIVAIVNERAAVEKRLEDAYGERLQRLSTVLTTDLNGQPAPSPPVLAERVLSLGQQLFPGERARFELARDPGDPLQSLLASFGSDEGGFGPPVARRALAGELAGNVVVVRLPSAQSPATIALTNRVVYIVLLCLFYGIIATGVAITLRVAWREARLSRLKSDFVSHVSHELRTPLTSIRMFVETLRTGRATDEEEREACLNHLDHETERLSTLVDRLLDWARMESGRKIYRKSPEPPDRLVREALTVFGRQRGGETPGVEVEVASDLPAVDVDRDAIEVVLVNLLTNAWKYTGTDKKIRLRAHAAGGRVALEVEDNGPGIPKAERKRVFEHFYRVDDLLTRRTEGTGLGLAICKRIVEDHGGHIEIAGEEGRGSRFTVLLPAAA